MEAKLRNLDPGPPRRPRGARDLIFYDFWFIFGLGFGTLRTQARALFQTRFFFAGRRPQQKCRDFGSIFEPILAPFSMFLDRRGNSVF